MVLRQLFWGRVVFGLVLGTALLALGGSAVAQGGPGVAGIAAGPWQEPTLFVGDYLCSVCHAQEYADYSQHGHPWMVVHTGGKTPTTNLFAPVGAPMPTLPSNVTWAQVQDIVANFKERTGEGDFLLTDGRLAEQNATPGGPASFINPMPTTCNHCHNTTWTNATAGYAGNQLYPGMTAPSKIQGMWELNGVQCEQCHGPGPSMYLPTGDTGNALCRDCHSSGDIVPGSPETSQYRIPFNTTTMQFSNHHPQGDEYRRSPHQNLGCYACHDPHKSVWHEQGGVLFAPANDPGNMCTNCHTERVLGAMGQSGVGLECTDCHMPEISAGGTRTAHLFKINSAPLAAKNNVITQNNTSGKPTVYWMNADGTTSPSGLSFLTLDLVCTQCHGSMMTLQQMSNAAQYIHRPPGMIDLTANGSESLTIIKKNTPLTVAFSVYAGTEAGSAATWWVMCQGPKGWMSWNGKTWVKGQLPWRKGVAVTNVTNQVVLSGTQSLPGTYTYWVAIYPSDGTSNVATVPVLVTQ